MAGVESAVCVGRAGSPSEGPAPRPRRLELRRPLLRFILLTEAAERGEMS